MGQAMAKHYDLAIRGNNKKTSITRLMKSGKVSVWGRPKYFLPGGWVAIVGKENRIQLMFKAVDIRGSKKLKLLNDKTRENSYSIKADKATFIVPENTSSPITRWRAIGQYRYFDKVKMKAIQIEPRSRSTGTYIDNHTQEIAGNVFKPHTYGIPGKDRNHPEAQLVEQYVQWMGGKERFGHNYIRSSGLYVDLFDKTFWQLIEAKASISREALRMAIGQIRDYKRFYKRPACLAVLLPSCPSDSRIKLLTDNHISVIWKNDHGAFITERWQDWVNKG
jgi:hypothetical protein